MISSATSNISTVVSQNILNKIIVSWMIVAMAIMLMTILEK